jgi:hypothetical protein
MGTLGDDELDGVAKPKPRGVVPARPRGDVLAVGGLAVALAAVGVVVPPVRPLVALVAMLATCYGVGGLGDAEGRMERLGTLLLSFLAWGLLAWSARP